MISAPHTERRAYNDRSLFERKSWGRSYHRKGGGKRFTAKLARKGARDAARDAARDPDSE